MPVRRSFTPKGYPQVDNTFQVTRNDSTNNLFFKLWPILASFPFIVVLFSIPILMSITKIEKAYLDGVIGIRARGHRMVGADETRELWRPHSTS